MVRIFRARALFSRSIDSICSSVHESGGGVMANVVSSRFGVIWLMGESLTRTAPALRRSRAIAC